MYGYLMKYILITSFSYLFSTTLNIYIYLLSDLSHHLFSRKFHPFITIYSYSGNVNEYYRRKIILPRLLVKSEQVYYNANTICNCGRFNLFHLVLNVLISYHKF